MHMLSRMVFEAGHDEWEAEGYCFAGCWDRGEWPGEQAEEDILYGVREMISVLMRGVAEPRWRRVEVVNVL